MDKGQEILNVAKDFMKYLKKQHLRATMLDYERFKHMLVDAECYDKIAELANILKI